MSKVNHILFLVPDGVGIKNYLYSELISHLKQDADITIWSPLPEEAFVEVKRVHQIEFNYKQITLSPEKSITRLYREATTYARLKHNTALQDNPTIMTNWRRPNYSFKVKMLYRLAEKLGNYLYKNYNKILKFEERSINHIPKNVVNTYAHQLKAINPTSIFITHQRVPGLMPICVAAQQLCIKTATAIFSWDNLPKARLAVKTDDYYVWSQWMKDEMMAYYPEIPEDHVKIVGTPQFEFYLDKDRRSARADFAKEYDLDHNKKWICFSGDDIITSPYDQLFLNDVAEALKDKAEETQIIFRRCPVDFSDRYDEVLEKFSGLIVSIDPIWNVASKTGWIGYFPLYNDINMQINLAYHCEAVINLGSTMALDFATFNKPCFYLKYNPAQDANWNTETIYNFQHFRSMKGLNPVIWIEDKSDILELVSNVLEVPKDYGKDKITWLEKLVCHPLNENSKYIAKELL